MSGAGDAPREGGTTHGSALARRRSQRADSVLYQEDDATFKNRLKEIIVDHTLLNSVATMVVIVLVFRVLAGEWFVGIVAGLLVVTVSNLSNAMWRINDFERWEIFSNGVNLGYDPKGRVKFVRFSDIRSISLDKGLRRQVMVIELGDRKLRYPYDDNREMFDLLMRKYRAFEDIQRSPSDDR